MKTKVEKALKYLAISVFLIALAINVKVTLGDSFTLMSDAAIATATAGATTFDSSGGLIPGWDEMQRDCSIPLGGGGELGVDFSLTPTGPFTISLQGKYYRPASVAVGKELNCTWAWAFCTPGDCIPTSTL